MSARSKRIPTSNCDKFYESEQLELSENQICYGNDLYIAPNSCQLNWGGPIERKYHGLSTSFLPYQLGINIHGNDCGFGFPAVATRVSQYIDWVDSVIFGSRRPLLSYPSDVNVPGGGISCNLPNGRQGQCKKSSECFEVVDLVKSGKASIRDYICDFADSRNPSVCCPTRPTDSVAYDFSSKFEDYIAPVLRCGNTFYH